LRAYCFTNSWNAKASRCLRLGRLAIPEHPARRSSTARRIISLPAWIWDAEKAEANRRKHGVSFQLAVRVLDDPLRLELPDPYPGDERWRVIDAPFSGSPVVLFVVYAEPRPRRPGDDQAKGRIIPARRATSHERRLHEQG
jgi:uncharacterized protein